MGIEDIEDDGIPFDGKYDFRVGAGSAKSRHLEEEIRKNLGGIGYFSEWREVVLKDVIEFNPKESIKKGTVTKKIGMDKLAPFQRKIDGFELAEFLRGIKV